MLCSAKISFTLNICIFHYSVYIRLARLTLVNGLFNDVGTANNPKTKNRHVLCF